MSYVLPISIPFSLKPYIDTSPHGVTCFDIHVGGGPRVVVSTAAFHSRARGSAPGLGGLKETKMFLPHPRLKVSIVGSLRDREVLLAQFSLYVHKGADSFHLIYTYMFLRKKINSSLKPLTCNSINLIFY